MGLKTWLGASRAPDHGDRHTDVQALLDAIERLEAQQRRTADQIKRLLRDQERLMARVDDGAKTESKWRKIFNHQLSALVRHVCLPLDRLPPSHALNARRFRLRSQNEEDGILYALLERAGWGRRRFVEIGSGKSGGTAASLAHDCGWSGLMIELSAASVELARRKFAGNRGVTVVRERVDPQNVNAILTDHGYGGDVDLLSIDIDSYDYWVLEALTAVSARVLVLEYNALFGPERRVTIPPNQSLDSTPKGYGGASLAALEALARTKGYRLVACENAGVNAFFLRDDVAPGTEGVTPREAFKPLRSRTDLEDAEVCTDIYAAVERLRLPLVDV
ncbi:MAG TPA: class I SAM-dependent methyltransferase [Vicinamibacterales bacterium]|nr:class I SAM-dependent methyltransferase [Vicinamibacterales bacterium]